MIVPNINSNVRGMLEATYYAGAGGEVTDKVVDKYQAEMIALIREEAVMLADRIIGKDRVIHGETDLEEGIAVMNQEDKAVYDFQVKQRIELAKYQNPQFGPTGPDELINPDLSENEA